MSESTTPWIGCDDATIERLTQETSALRAKVAEARGAAYVRLDRPHQRIETTDGRVTAVEFGWRFKEVDL